MRPLKAERSKWVTMAKVGVEIQPGKAGDHDGQRQGRWFRLTSHSGFVLARCEYWYGVCANFS